ncbi:MAG: DnaT-like ssDNA-binding protein [Nitrospirales bacterium]
MATRVLSAYAQPSKSLISTDKPPFYYRVRRQWTGQISTQTQNLPWPRIGMYDGIGVPIPITDIPDELKEATAELAGQLVMADTTLDNAVAVQGIKSVAAGSVSVSFKDMIETRVLPDAVWNLMPPSWFTAETIEPVLSAYLPAQFDVVSK